VEETKQLCKQKGILVAKRSKSQEILELLNGRLNTQVAVGSIAVSNATWVIQDPNVKG